MRLRTFSQSTVFAALVCSPLSTLAVNKCLIDRKVVFQDAVCPGALGTIETDLKRKEAETVAARQTAILRQSQEVQVVREAEARDPGFGRCKAADFQQRIDQYIKQYPHMQSAMNSVMQSGRPYVGMPEEMLMLFICSSIKTKNVTQTVVGTDTQIVLKEHPPLLAKYIYVRNGVVYAVQQ